MGGLRAYFDPEYLKMPEIPQIIPAPLLAWFNSPEGKWFDEDGEAASCLSWWPKGPDLGPVRASSGKAPSDNIARSIGASLG